MFKSGCFSSFRWFLPELCVPFAILVIIACVFKPECPFSPRCPSRFNTMFWGVNKAAVELFPDAVKLLLIELPWRTVTELECWPSLVEPVPPFVAALWIWIGSMCWEEWLLPGCKLVGKPGWDTRRPSRLFPSIAAWSSEGWDKSSYTKRVLEVRNW